MPRRGQAVLAPIDRPDRDMLDPVPPAPTIPPVTLVTGDEDVLVTRAVATVVAAARATDPEAEVVERRPGEFTETDVLDLASPSMFGGLRVMVLRGAEELTDALRDAVVSYGANPLPDVALVVVHSGANRNRKLVEALKKSGAKVVPAARITRPRDRHDFVVGEVRRLGGRISDGAVRALLDAVGSDLREVAAVCDQLLTDTGGTVDEAAVLRYHRGRAETTGFAVADAAIAGNLPQALTLLRQALHGGTATVLISSAVASGLRELARVAAAGGGSPAQLARRLGLPDWKVERAQRSARQWSDEGLALALRAAGRADAEVKGAGSDAGYALERLVMDVVAARGRAAARR